MNRISLYKNAFLLLLAVVLIVSCSHKKKHSGLGEGKIIYDVTYPNDAPSLILDLYPKELVFYFKDDKMLSELKSSYDLISTQMIIDNSHKNYTQMLKNMRERSYMSLSERETKSWMDKQYNLRLQETDESIVIAGKRCNKVLAFLPESDKPPLELYYTNDLSLSPDNWWNQFEGVDGFLLGYDIEAFGKRMRIRAREIINESVNDLKFEIPANYVEVTSAVMELKLGELMTEYASK